MSIGGATRRGDRARAVARARIVGRRLPATHAQPGLLAERLAEDLVRDRDARDVLVAIEAGDGLLTDLGELNFEILRDEQVRVVRVSEEAIVAAARFFLHRMKLVVEPSGATVLAALRAVGDELTGLRIGAVLSGGNTDFAWL